MGGAFTATANDISAIYWNPAGLASNLSGEAFFNHTDWFLDIAMEFAGVAVHVPGIGTIGGFVTALTMDDMLVRTEDQPEGTGEMARECRGRGDCQIEYPHRHTADIRIGRLPQADQALLFRRSGRNPP